MPKNIKKPLKITLIIGLKSKKKVAGNKERFERKIRLWGGRGGIFPGWGGDIFPNIS